jgi:hypothetical protein
MNENVFSGGGTAFGDDDVVKVPYEKAATKSNAPLVHSSRKFGTKSKMEVFFDCYYDLLCTYILFYIPT